MHPRSTSNGSKRRRKPVSTATTTPVGSSCRSPSRCTETLRPGLLHHERLRELLRRGGGIQQLLQHRHPSADPPNAAIYALWQDLIVDDQVKVDYTALEVDGQSLFVIEWENIAQLGTDNRLDMEVKLWENGTVDLLYGDGIDKLGGGSGSHHRNGERGR